MVVVRPLGRPNPSPRSRMPALAHPKIRRHPEADRLAVDLKAARSSPQLKGQTLRSVSRSDGRSNPLPARTPGAPLYLAPPSLSTLRHPRVDEVPDGRAPQVVAKHAGETRLFAGCGPGLPEAAEALAPVGAGEVGENGAEWFRKLTAPEPRRTCDRAREQRLTRCQVRRQDPPTAPPAQGFEPRCGHAGPPLQEPRFREPQQDGRGLAHRPGPGHAPLVPGSPEGPRRLPAPRPRDRARLIRACKASRLGLAEFRRGYPRWAQDRRGAGCLAELQGLAQRGTVTLLCACPEEARLPPGAPGAVLAGKRPSR